MTSGSVAHYAGAGDGLWFAATGEGGSSVDYRVYFRGLNQTTTTLYPAGGQNNTATYYQTNFPGGVTAPAAQTTLFPSQTGATGAGSIGWQWRQVKITKQGTSVTWDIDGIRMANIDLSVVTTPFGGDNILFQQGDINAGQTTLALDPMLFGLIDNVEVRELAETRTVSAILMDPDSTVVDTISEADPSVVATFKISRPAADVAAPLPVNFTLTGSATRGPDATSGDYYIRTNGVIIPTASAVTIPAGSDNVMLEIVPNNDTISELTETVTLTLAPGTYVAIPPTGGTVKIVDNDPTTIDIGEVTFNQMFEGDPFDIVRFKLERRGDTNSPAFDVNIAYAGTATKDVDYHSVATVHFEPGDLTANLDVQVIDDQIVEGNETIIASIASGAGYTVGANNVLTAGATATIVDDDTAPESPVFADNFNDPADDANWTLLFGSVNPDSLDYTARFGVDYAAELGVPPAPHSNGDSVGLVLSVNKLDSIPEAAGLNLYPKNKTFSGDFAVRFDMYLMQNGSAGTTEYAAFGINHDGTHTNWFRNSGTGVPAGWSYDGIWAYVEADGAGLGDYVLNSAPAAGLGGPTALASRSAASLENVFHQPPWTADGAGAPANSVATATPSWAEVELKQVAGVVTLTINNTQIITYTNKTAFTSGDIMLGYNDAYDSIGSGGGGLVIYDNLRVIPLTVVSTRPTITAVTQVGSNLQIDFNGVAGAPLASFKVYGSATVGGPYTEVTGATYSVVTAGDTYRAVVPISGATGFFQIAKTP